ncbi:unnamed protein product [Amoebophrya sp. A25]|nr:unnamed protein product [Amoebophrya sp. A25]|eukprot:GSA25T00015476001.1
MPVSSSPSRVPVGATGTGSISTKKESLLGTPSPQREGHEDLKLNEDTSKELAIDGEGHEDMEVDSEDAAKKKVDAAIDDFYSSTFCPAGGQVKSAGPKEVHRGDLDELDRENAEEVDREDALELDGEGFEVDALPEDFGDVHHTRTYKKTRRKKWPFPRRVTTRLERIKLVLRKFDKDKVVGEMMASLCVDCFRKPPGTRTEVEEETLEMMATALNNILRNFMEDMRKEFKPYFDLLQELQVAVFQEQSEAKKELQTALQQLKKAREEEHGCLTACEEVQKAKREFQRKMELTVTKAVNDSMSEISLLEQGYEKFLHLRDRPPKSRETRVRMLQLMAVFFQTLGIRDVAPFHAALVKEKSERTTGGCGGGEQSASPPACSGATSSSTTSSRATAEAACSGATSSSTKSSRDETAKAAAEYSDQELLHALDVRFQTVLEQRRRACGQHGHSVTVMQDELKIWHSKITAAKEKLTAAQTALTTAQEDARTKTKAYECCFERQDVLYAKKEVYEAQEDYARVERHRRLIADAVRFFGDLRKRDATNEKEDWSPVRKIEVEDEDVNHNLSTDKELNLEDADSGAAHLQPQQCGGEATEKTRSKRKPGRPRKKPDSLVDSHSHGEEVGATASSSSSTCSSSTTGSTTQRAKKGSSTKQNTTSAKRRKVELPTIMEEEEITDLNEYEDEWFPGFGDGHQEDDLLADDKDAEDVAKGASNKTKGVNKKNKKTTTSSSSSSTTSTKGNRGRNKGAKKDSGKKDLDKNRKAAKKAARKNETEEERKLRKEAKAEKKRRKDEHTISGGE